MTASTMLMMEGDVQTTDDESMTNPRSLTGGTLGHAQRAWGNWLGTEDTLQILSRMFLTYSTTGPPVTSRKDWMTTEKRSVALERQVTPGTDWNWGTRGSIPNCSPRERTPTKQLQTPIMKDTLRVYREGGRMIDSHGRILWNRHGLPKRQRKQHQERLPAHAARSARTNTVCESTKESLVANVRGHVDSA